MPMPVFKSPGVYTKEVDTNYNTRLSESEVELISYAMHSLGLNYDELRDVTKVREKIREKKIDDIITNV